MTGTDDNAREAERQRKIRGRNIALLIVLVTFIVLVFCVTLVQLKRGTEVRLAPAAETGAAPDTGQGEGQ